MSAAIELARWYLEVYLSIFSPQYKHLPTKDSDAKKLLVWLSKKAASQVAQTVIIHHRNYSDTITFLRNHIRQSGPLRDSARLELALAVLANEGLVYPSTAASGARIVQVRRNASDGNLLTF